MWDLYASAPSCLFFAKRRIFSNRKTCRRPRAPITRNEPSAISSPSAVRSGPFQPYSCDWISCTRTASSCFLFILLIFDAIPVIVANAKSTTALWAGSHCLDSLYKEQTRTFFKMNVEREHWVCTCKSRWYFRILWTGFSRYEPRGKAWLSWVCFSRHKAASASSRVSFPKTSIVRG